MWVAAVSSWQMISSSDGLKLTIVTLSEIVEKHAGKNYPVDTI